MNRKRPPPARDMYASGETVPLSGIYKTIHPHPLSPKITLLRLQIFPGCPRCAAPVNFAIVSCPPVESASERFRLLMGSRAAQIRRRNSIYKPTR